MEYLYAENDTMFEEMDLNSSLFGDFSNRSNKTPTEPPLYIVLISTLLYSLIFLVGIIGNILVVVVIVFSRTMKSPVNMYLMNLCVADVLVIVVCMPTALADIYTKEVWYFGAFMCKFVPYLENTVASASVLTILAISIERYRVVCNPLEVVNEDNLKVWKIVGIIWAVSMASNTPWLSIPIARKSNFFDGTPIEVCRIPISEIWQKGFVGLLAILFFVLPCVLLVALNCHLCRVLNRTGEYDSCIHELRNDRKRRLNQVVNIVASIVSVFFICHLPFRVAGLWLSFADKNDIWSIGLEKLLWIIYSARILFYLNHALNPVVYNFVSTKFRCALREMFSKTILSGICNKLTPKQKQSSNTKIAMMTYGKKNENESLMEPHTQQESCIFKNEHTQGDERRSLKLSPNKDTSSSRTNGGNQAFSFRKGGENSERKCDVNIDFHNKSVKIRFR